MEVSAVNCFGLLCIIIALFSTLPAFDSGYKKNKKNR